MKKLCYALLFGCVHITAVSQTQISASLIPTYSVASSTPASQMMTVCRMTLTGLTPGRTYRYLSALTTNATQPVSMIPTGGMFMINDQAISPSVDVVGYTDKKSFGGSMISSGDWNTAATGSYAQFTATSTTYTAWFAAVNDGSSALGSSVYFYVFLNDGLNGTIPVQHYRTTQTMIVRDFSSGTSGGVALTSTSIASNEQMVALYDNINGTGAPLFITWTENDGINQQWTTWYNSVFAPATAAPGKWAGWIPNNSSLGLMSVSYFDGSGNVQFRMADIGNDGQYNSNTIQTRGANSGTTALQIDGLNQVEKIIIVKPTDLQRNLTLNMFSPDGQIELYANLTVNTYNLSLNSNPILDPNSGGYKIVCDNTSTLTCAGTNAFTLPAYFSVVKNLNVSNPTGVKLGANLMVENQLDMSGNFGPGRLDINNFKLTLNGPPITPSNASGLFVSTGSATQSTLELSGNYPGLFIPSGLSDIKNLIISNPNGVALRAALDIRGDLTFANNALINNSTYSLNIAGNIYGQGGQELSSTGQVLIDNPTNSVRSIQGTWAVLTCNTPVVQNGNLTCVTTLSINEPFNISDYKLTVKGDWIGDPAFVSGGATSSIEFARSIPQSIPTTANIYNIGSLIINNNTTVSLNKNASLARSLELLQGTLLDGGNIITLAGDIKGSATIDGAGKVIMTGGASTQFISDANINNLELNNNIGFELNGTNTGNTNITKQLNLINGTLNVKNKGLFFTGSHALPVIRTNGKIQLTKQSFLGFGNKTSKHTGAAFTFPSGVFVLNSVSPTRTSGAVETGTFIINRTNSLTLNAQPLDIHKLLSIVEGNLILPDNYQIDLKSTAISETAMFDIITNTSTSKITYGSNSYFCIERFIPKDVDGGQGRRAFRDLAPGVVNTVGSMWSNWQEGAPITPISGFGTHITGKKGAPGINDAATGFDMTVSGEYSGRTFWTNPSTGAGAWVNITNTKTVEFNGLLPYRVLLRGDRNYNNWPNMQVMNNVVTLRAKGKLIIGDVNITSAGASAPTLGFSTSTMRMNTATLGGYTMVANPYAAPISWDQLRSHNPSIADYYTVIDPNIKALGAYVSYHPLVGPNMPTSAVSDAIQPGESFFVRNNNTLASSLTIKETDKVIDASKLTTVFKMSNFKQTNGGISKVRITLSRNDVVVDGAIVAYGEAFADNIDINDINKWTNTEDNLAILRSAKEYAIETRKGLTGKDTIPLQMTLLSANETYKLNVQLSDINVPFETEVFLYDANLKTFTPLSKTNDNVFAFKTSVSEETFKNRFSVIFRTAQALPANVLDFAGYAKGKEVLLTWNVSEESVKLYAVEKSSDGKSFRSVARINSLGKGNNNYEFKDFEPNTINYYRIQILNNDSSITYSKIIRVNMGEDENKISIYPNPITDYINISLNSAEINSTINVRILNSLGKLILTDQFKASERTMTKQLKLYALVSGKYTLQLITGTQTFSKTFEVIR